MAKKAIKVSQSTIDRIKKLGMTAALKKAGTSNNAEYVEGIRRMYGARRLAAAQKTSAPAPSRPSARVAERAIKKASPKVAERMPAAKKAVAAAPKSDLMSRRKAQAERARARFKRGLPQDVVKLGGSSKPKAKKAAPKPFVPGGRNR